MLARDLSNKIEELRVLNDKMAESMHCETDQWESLVKNVARLKVCFLTSFMKISLPFTCNTQNNVKTRKFSVVFLFLDLTIVPLSTKTYFLFFLEWGCWYSKATFNTGSNRIYRSIDTTKKKAKSEYFKIFFFKTSHLIVWI